MNAKVSLSICIVTFSLLGHKLKASKVDTLCIRSHFDVVTFNSFSRKKYRLGSGGSRDDIYDYETTEQ